MTLWRRCVIAGRPRRCALLFGNGFSIGISMLWWWGIERITLHRIGDTTLNIGPLFLSRKAAL